MVTYAELIQIGLLTVAVLNFIALVVSITITVVKDIHDSKKK